MTTSFIDFVFKFSNNIRKNNVTLIYEGEISHDIIKAFTFLTEKELKAKRENNPTQKKVFNVMVECLQNISKHSDNMGIQTSKNGRGILLISEDDKFYNITTGNTIKNENIDSVRNNIDKVNSLNKEELREFYKKTLSNGRLSKKDGAGLGFIDIRRKSNNNLEYHFLDIDKDYKFFILNTTIEK